MVHRAGQVHEAQASGVDDGAFRGRDQFRIIAAEFRVAAGHHDRRTTEELRGLQGFALFVEAGFGHRDGEGRDRPAECPAGHRHNQRRVDAAGEVRHHRHIGPQAPVDRGVEDGFEFIDDSGFVCTVVFFPAIRVVHFPVNALLRLRCDIRPPRFQVQVATGENGLHTLEHRRWAGDREEAQDLAEPGRIGLRRHESGSEQRFDFRGEQ